MPRTRSCVCRMLAAASASERQSLLMRDGVCAYLRTACATLWKCRANMVRPAAAAGGEEGRQGSGRAMRVTGLATRPQSFCSCSVLSTCARARSK